MPTRELLSPVQRTQFLKVPAEMVENTELQVFDTQVLDAGVYDCKRESTLLKTDVPPMQWRTHANTPPPISHCARVAP